MKTKAFEKKVEEITKVVLKELDPAKFQATIVNEVSNALLQASMNSLGFDYDGWARKYKLPHDSYSHSENRSLFQAVEEKARAEATRLMEEVDLSKVALNKSDKNAILSAYKKARREYLEEEARKLAVVDAKEMVKEVFETVKAQAQSETKPRSSESELVDLVFSQTEENAEENDKENAKEESV